MQTSFEKNANEYAEQMKNINPAWKIRVRKIKTVNAWAVEAYSKERGIWLNLKVF